MIKDLLSFIVTNIADHPEEVVVDKEENEQFYYTNFVLKIHPDDMGKIIGKNGKTIKAIRLLARVPAITQNRRINIELVEPDDHSPSQSLS